MKSPPPPPQIVLEFCMQNALEYTWKRAGALNSERVLPLHACKDTASGAKVAGRQNANQRGPQKNEKNYNSKFNIQH
jgi:hypothetical protein